MTEKTHDNFLQQHAESDAQLVLRCRNGEVACFDELVRRYQRKATSIAYQLLNNHDDAMEVTQETFLRAFDRLNTLDEPRRFGSWLLRILNNQALNRRRARALRKTSSLEAGSNSKTLANSDTSTMANSTPTPLEEITSRDTRSLMRDAIDQLPDMDRQALILFSIEKLPQKQVAEIMDCSVEAVKWHVFAARKKLKEKLVKFI